MTSRRHAILAAAMLAIGAGAPLRTAQSEEYFEKSFRVPHGAAPTWIGRMGQGWEHNGRLHLYPRVSDLGSDVIVDYPPMPPASIAPMFGRLYRFQGGFNWVQDKDMPPGLEWDVGSFGIPLQSERGGMKRGMARIHDQNVYVERIEEDEEGPYAIMSVIYRAGGAPRGTPQKLRAGDVLTINNHRNKILRVVPRSYRLDSDLPFEEKYIVIGWVEIDPKPLTE